MFGGFVLLQGRTNPTSTFRDCKTFNHLGGTVQLKALLSTTIRLTIQQELILNFLISDFIPELHCFKLGDALG
jgi:hypothetical protein